MVIPIAVYGISLISRVQLGHPADLAGAAIRCPHLHRGLRGHRSCRQWTHFTGAAGGGEAVDLPLFGMAASMLLSLLPQIGEQVDYLRFLPARKRGSAASAGGPRCCPPARDGF